MALFQVDASYYNQMAQTQLGATAGLLGMGTGGLQGMGLGDSPYSTIATSTTSWEYIPGGTIQVGVPEPDPPIPQEADEIRWLKRRIAEVCWTP